MARLAKILKTDAMADMDLQALAQVLRSHGRGRDTVLAHITPAEAKLLKDRGGRGSINPDTGLPEFDDFGDFGGFVGGDYGATPDYGGQVPAAAFTTDVGAPAGGGYSGEGGFTAAPAAGGAATSDSSAFGAGYGYFPGAGAAAAPGGDVTAPPGALPGAPVPTAPGVVTPTGADLSQIQGRDMDKEATVPTAPRPGIGAQIGDWLGQGKNLAGLAGVLGIGGLGLFQRQQAMQQAAAAQKQIGALGKPLQQQGQQLISQAQAGSLSPASMQSYQAAQAQLAQNVARTGGVGAAQAASQLEMVRQQLLNNQLQLGLQQLSAGNQYVYQGIMAGLNAGGQANQAMGQFASALGGMVGGRAGVFG